MPRTPPGCGDAMVCTGCPVMVFHSTIMESGPASAVATMDLSSE